MDKNLTTLEDWLAYVERLHAQPIDMGLERVHAVWQRMGVKVDAPVITVAGTNGKGSTCAILECILRESGYRVGVYTSPHLIRFEERCRVDGQAVQAPDLLPHFQKVDAARGETSLTYFEFTTLAILSLLASSGLDALVLEVGLGGRLDAVNIIDPDCAVITSIDLDHMDYLGPDRESIGREKAGIMRAGRPVIVGDPVPPTSVIDHAREIGADLWLAGRDHSYSAQQGPSGQWQQWAWAGRTQRYAGLAYPALRGTNQLLNASGALAALEAVRQPLPISAQAVRVGLARVELPGRFQIVPGQPTLVLDVAHNPHAVAALARNLDQMGFYPRTHAVFGAMGDKDVGQMLRHLLPLIENWYCCDLPTARAAKATELQAAIQQAAAAVPGLRAQTSAHAGPVEALAAAIAAADPPDRILVFGSFYTVGGVLQQGLPRLMAKHLGSGPAA